MTQQDIYQNMTKSFPWESGKFFQYLVCTESLIEAVAHTHNATDTKAIVSAVNNTYGQGINPEEISSAIAALQFLCDQLEGKDKIEIVNGGMIHSMISVALKAVKL